MRAVEEVDGDGLAYKYWKDNIDLSKDSGASFREPEVKLLETYSHIYTGVLGNITSTEH